MTAKKVLKALSKIFVALIVIFAIMALCCLIIYLTLGIEFHELGSEEKWKEIIEKAGWYGKALFVLISFLQVTFVPIPGSITIILGNYLFGFWESALLSFIGMTIGALFAFYLGRKIGRPFINWVIGDSETVSKYLKRAEGKENVLFFFMFLFPFFPDDALCSVAGCTSITWPGFILMQLITRPTSIIATLLFYSGEYIPFSGWGLWVIGISLLIGLILFVIAYIKSDKINALIDTLSAKITNKFKKKPKEKDE